MLTGNRRSDLEVVADILRIKGSKTAIMYGANLSYAQTQEYLRLLAERGFIEVTDQGKRRHYCATAKGMKLLELLHTLEEMAGQPGGPP